MNDFSPGVSIIIPMYNVEKYVGDTIRSVLLQTFTTWELLLIDDGSTDRTKEIVMSFLHDRRIIYKYQENRGIASARNMGIKSARGEYLAFLDADDLCNSKRLERQLLILQEKNVELVFSRLECIDDNSNSLGIKIGSGLGIYEGFSALLLLIAGSITIPNSSVIVKKEWVNRVDNYEEKDQTAIQMEDYDLWIRLLSAGASFYGLNEVLGSYRKHIDQISQNCSDRNLLMIRYINRLIKKYPGKKPYLKFLILLRLSLFHKNEPNKRMAKRVCINIYHSNKHIDHYWFDSLLLRIMNIESYLWIRRLLIRRFRRFKTYVNLSGK